ncbi:MAG: YwaF family protein [Firmicutes bacterium]|nr:YwaF family protein [Bacillota bacterium]
MLLTVCTVLLTKWLSKKSESLIRKVFFGIWVWMVLSEATVILWETYCGADVWFELTGNLPLYPCSVFLYAMPMVLWGKGWLREAGCGYICTVGLVGGLINFVYPANVLGTYSCLSFAGMRSLLYHGSMVLCALVMLVSGLHSFRWKGAEPAAAERQKGAAASNLRAAAGPKLWHLLVPAIPCLLVSIPANLVNFVLVPNADYMFFKLESFFLAPLGAVLPKWFTVLIMYIVYLAASAGPYLPGWLKARKERV